MTTVYKGVNVDVEIKLDDVLDFINDCNQKELDLIIKEIEYFNSTNIKSGIADTQRYSDLMEAVENAVNRYVDIQKLTNLINEFK